MPKISTNSRHDNSDQKGFVLSVNQLSIRWKGVPEILVVLALMGGISGTVLPGEEQPFETFPSNCIEVQSNT